jgi:hypothetical protein
MKLPTLALAAATLLALGACNAEPAADNATENAGGDAAATDNGTAADANAAKPAGDAAAPADANAAAPAADKPAGDAGAGGNASEAPAGDKPTE